MTEGLQEQVVPSDHSSEYCPFRMAAEEVCYGENCQPVIKGLSRFVGYGAVHVIIKGLYEFGVHDFTRRRGKKAENVKQLYGTRSRN